MNLPKTGRNTSRAAVRVSFAPVNGENFLAWETEGTLIYPGDKITVTKNTTLTAVYTNKPQTVAITYHYNFGDNTQPFIDSGYPKNTTATVRSYDYVGFFAPTGYEFLGWATTPNGNVEYQPNKKVFVDANDDNNLYAVWQVKTYTVKWVDDDETTLIDQKDYEYGAIPKFEGVEPTKAADAQYTYTFKGWDKDYTEVKGNQTYVAVYEKTTNKYNVTYDLNGGEWTEATNEFPYEYKATVEVVKTVPTREGYKFSGWRSEEVTIENDAFTMPAKDVVLKAVWEANPTPTPIPSEEPTPTPAPTEEPTPHPLRQRSLPPLRLRQKSLHPLRLRQKSPHLHRLRRKSLHLHRLRQKSLHLHPLRQKSLHLHRLQIRTRTRQHLLRRR